MTGKFAEVEKVDVVHSIHPIRQMDAASAA